MKKGAVVAVALILASLPPGPASAADKKLHDRLQRLKSSETSDHRVIVDSTKSPWRAIGRLNRRTGGHCTATVIAPRLVLTAAHCLWNQRTLNFLPSVSLHFVAGWSKGEYLFHSAAAYVTIALGYQPKAPANAERFAHDWALVKLVDDPVPVTGKIVPVPLKPYLAGIGGVPMVTQAGYSADTKHVLSAHIDCRIQGFDAKYMLAIHACDALPGDSGSPILSKRKDGVYELVAIHVGYFFDKKAAKGRGLAVPGETFLPEVERAVKTR